MIVDIKRGSINVSSHDERHVLIELEVPNYTPKSKNSEGLRELRPNNLDALTRYATLLESLGERGSTAIRNRLAELAAH